jgi:hypothetical protein
MTGLPKQIKNPRGQTRGFSFSEVILLALFFRMLSPQLDAFQKENPKPKRLAGSIKSK